MKELERFSKNFLPISDYGVCPNCKIGELKFSFSVKMLNEEETDERFKIVHFDVYKCTNCGEEFI